MKTRSTALVLCCIALMVGQGTSALTAGPHLTATTHDKVTTSIAPVDANTDFFSDEQWRQLPRQERQGRFRRAFLARLEPSGTPQAERHTDYIERYKRAVMFDARLGVFDVKSALVDKNSWRLELRGEVSLPQYKHGLLRTLQELGFTVEHEEIALLPSLGLGTAVYAVSTTTAATMRREPRPDAEQINSIALGWPLRLLRPARLDDFSTVALRAEFRGAGRGQANRSRLQPRAAADVPSPEGWYLAQSAEGYVGFVRGDEIHRADTYELPRAILAEPTTVSLARQHSYILPMGAGLQRDEATGLWSVQVGEETVRLDPTHVKVRTTPAPITSEQILALAKPLLGTKYVWGGVTQEGIDCSGFTQLILRLWGINLPRDAEEQAIVGSIVAFGSDVAQKARPGDLIFFVNEYGKVSHVAISLGGKRVVHSSQRDVHESTLDETRENSDERLIERVFVARRVFGW
jgi:cell wall-associated NlpC family hydrolase